MYQGKDRQLLPDVVVTLEEVNLLKKKYPWLLTAFVASTMGVIQRTEGDICLKIFKYFYLNLPLMNMVFINLADLVLKQKISYGCRCNSGGILHASAISKSI